MVSGAAAAPGFVAAAISDAVWHAIGKRLRSTPILTDPLLKD